MFIESGTPFVVVVSFQDTFLVGEEVTEVLATEDKILPCSAAENEEDEVIEDTLLLGRVLDGLKDGGLMGLDDCCSCCCALNTTASSAATSLPDFDESSLL